MQALSKAKPSQSNTVGRTATATSCRLWLPITANYSLHQIEQEKNATENQNKLFSKQTMIKTNITPPIVKKGLTIDYRAYAAHVWPFSADDTCSCAANFIVAIKVPRC
jgi:hypothetical protein